MVHYLTEDLKSVFADQATVIAETARFMLELKTEQCQEFLTKVSGMAVSAGCKVSQLCSCVAVVRITKHHGGPSLSAQGPTSS